MTKIGELGEKLVAKWLETEGWLILHRRWRCRWGEIDIIAQQPSSAMLTFVEVKTRSSGNWDENGLLAINAQKRQKIVQTATVFLAKYPNLVELTCRFDVALVAYRKIPLNSSSSSVKDICQSSDQLSKISLESGYELVLKHYLDAAFDDELII